MTRTSADISSGENDKVSVNRLGRFARKTVAILLSSLLVFQPMIANAQSIAASPTAPPANQPGVGAAPNGVPLVDIVTPNGAGLSHNKYDNFNVGTPGLILNNNNAEVGTSNLGGVTPGNPNLKNSGPASVILNEVTSGNRSALNGPTEVYGGRADVVIANPNGITCDGCGFINTPHATLTTGVPDIGTDGRLTGFTINGGDVTFGPNGGNFAAAPGTVDLFDVVSRTISVNGPVYGKALRLTAGANKFDYATGEAQALTPISGTPEYAIDGTALGAMQADRIKVVVTEKGAGVRMSGNMAANTNELSLSADGKISLGNVSGQQGVSVTSKAKVTAAKVASKARVDIKADQGITLNAVAADGDIALSSGAGLLSADAEVNSATNVLLASASGIAAGSVTAGGAATLAASSGDVRIAGGINSAGALTITADTGSITAASLLSYNNIGLNAGADIAVSGNVLAQGNVTANGQAISTGMVVSGLDIAGTNAAPNGNTALASVGDIQLAASSGEIDATALLSAGNIVVNAPALRAQNITAHGAVDINAAIKVDGQILGAGDVAITANGTVDSQAMQVGGTIASGVDFAATEASGGNIVLGSTGALSLRTGSGNMTVGSLLSAGNLYVQSLLLDADSVIGHRDIVVDGGASVENQFLAANNITFNGKPSGPGLQVGLSAGLLVSGVDIAATNAAGGNIVLAQSGDLTVNSSLGHVTAGTILSAGNMIVDGWTTVADTISGHGDIALSGAINVSGQVLGAGNITASGPSVRAGVVVSGVDFAATEAANGNIVQTQSGDLTIASSANVYVGSLNAAGTLGVSGPNIVVDSITGHKDIALSGATTVTGQVLGAGNIGITGQGINAAAIIAGIDFAATNAGGGDIILTQSGDLTISVTDAIKAPTMMAAGAINATGATLTATNITGHGDITLSGATDVSGQILGAENISVSGPAIQAGAVISGVDFAGTATANGSIVQTASGDITLTSSGSADIDTLLAAGGLTADAVELRSKGITSHGDTTVNASLDVDGQVLSASRLTVNGGSIAADTLISGIDFAATNTSGGNIVLAQSGGMTLAATGNIIAGTMLAAGDLSTQSVDLSASSITSHGNAIIAASGDVNVGTQVIAAGDLAISGADIAAPLLISGVDFVATDTAGGTIVLGQTGAMTLTAANGAVSTGTVLSAGDLTARAGILQAQSITSHGNVGITGSVDLGDSGQILSAGSLGITGGQNIEAGLLISGIDFAVTDNAGGTITLAGTGDMTLGATSGIKVSNILSAGALDAEAATMAAAGITGHKDIRLTGATDVSGQILGAGNVTLTGNSIKAGSVISGTDFVTTSASSSGAIAVGSAGDLVIDANTSGSVDIGTLLSAGMLTVDAASFTANNVTGHGAVSIDAATNVQGQILAASGVSVAGASIHAGVVVSGVDLAATSRSTTGDIVLGANAVDLTLIATAGDIAAGNLLSAGSLGVRASGNITANAVAHKDMTGTAGGAITLTGQSLAAGNVNLSAQSISVGTLVSGLDFAATNASSSGSLMLQRSGAMNLTASNGSITAGTALLSGGDLAANAHQDISYALLQSLGNASLTAPGQISYGNLTSTVGNLALTTGNVDLSNGRGGHIATGGTLTVNAASAAFNNSRLVLGGLALNLSGNADLTNAQISTATNAGGSGDITISASSLITSDATELLAAHDLALTLSSLGNAGQLAAGHDLTLNTTGDFTNTASGLVYAVNAANLFVAGGLTNDHGAIMSGGNLTIAGGAQGQRNNAVVNRSGLIQAGGDMSIVTSNLVNERLTTPTWVTGQLISSGAVVGTFVLNPDVAGKPFAYLETSDQNIFQLYPGIDPPSWQEYEPQLWSQATLADGTVYHAWTWVSDNGPTEVRPILDWIKDRVPKDANGTPVLDANNPSKYFIVDQVIRGGSDTSTTYTWDPTANISQSVYEDRFTSALSPEAVIRAGRNLTIDATNLTNAYSAIEAGGNATLTGGTLTNTGVALNRTTTLTCNAQGACTAYNADGTADPSRNIASGTSIVSKTEVIGGAAGNIHAAGALSVNYGSVNNSVAAGSMTGGTAVASLSDPGDPLSALDGLTAGGALFNVNSAIAGITAGGGATAGAGVTLNAGNPTIGTGPSVGAGGVVANGGATVSGNSLVAKLGIAIGNADLAELVRVNGAELAAAAKPQSGGVGGTIPGQVFLFETRAAFLDVSKFYGSSYALSRLGYTPDTSVPFLGDAYFENQLVDSQLRQLVGEGLGNGSFIPGSDAIDQMKTLLDNGVAYAQAHGLAVGQGLTPEQAALLTQSIVIYQTQTVNGAQVLVPVVYVAAADKAKINGAGAMMSGGSVSMTVGDLNNSGAITAAGGMAINANTIKANGGSFLAGGGMTLAATNDMSLSGQTVKIGGQTMVNPTAGVKAGGNLQMTAGNAMTLNAVSVDAGGSAQLSAGNITLGSVKVDNAGQQNATGTRITAAGNLGIVGANDVDIIGSSAKAGGDLAVTATNGAVNIVSTDVARRTDDGYTKTARTDQQGAQLSAGGNLLVNGNQGVLISGSSVSAKGDVGLTSNGDINVTTSQSQSNSTFGKGSSSSTTHSGSDITAGGNIVAKSGADINVIGSKMSADGAVSLQAKDNVTIGEAIDAYTLDVQSSTKKRGFLGTTTKENASGHLENTTAEGSTINGKDGVTIISGGDTTVSASKVTAGDSDHKADLNIQAGGNLIVSSGKDTETEHDSSKTKGFLKRGSSSYDAYNETTIGSQLNASGDINLDAGAAAVIAGSKANADGSINVSGNSVSIIGAQEEHEVEEQRKKSGLGVGSGSGFLSIYGSQQNNGKQSSTLNSGSALSAGEDVNLTARQTDLNIMGSSVSADRDINLSAARDVNVTPGAESFSKSEQEKKSGFGLSFSAGNGGFSVGIGAQKSKDSSAQQSDTNAISALTAGRDLNVSAGNNITLQATQASAERDVNLFAVNDINLLSANDVTNYEEMHEKTFAGVTLNVSSQVGSAAQSIMNSAERLSDAGGVNAVTNTAIAGLGFYQAYKDLKNAYSQLNGTDKDKKGLQFDVSLSVGANHQESSSSSSSSTPVITDIRAGRSITMEAQNGNITSDGAQISAGYDKNGLPIISNDPLTGDIFLSAANGNIYLNAATG
ncbi:two-partner secretion domain-containing protein, partial [Rhizobium rhizogenes]|uniref:two-partner secretion domain-containing protein n=1 Tax=Rhizobium rhizogenes TaxID=359 RepID=UPI0035AB76C4